jgi:hypothetical protein
MLSPTDSAASPALFVGFYSTLAEGVAIPTKSGITELDIRPLCLEDFQENLPQIPFAHSKDWVVALPSKGSAAQIDHGSDGSDRSDVMAGNTR